MVLYLYVKMKCLSVTVYHNNILILLQKYMIPLKSNNVLDKNVVDDIFYKIPEIATHHSIFLSFLEGRWKEWDQKETTVGDRIAYIVRNMSLVFKINSLLEFLCPIAVHKAVGCGELHFVYRELSCIREKLGTLPQHKIFFSKVCRGKFWDKPCFLWKSNSSSFCN